MSNKTLIILRGPSGSGKSTIARNILQDPKYFNNYQDWHEADHFFNDDVAQKYKFNYKQLPAAHKWCQANVARSLYFQRPIVIVSNTSILHKDVLVYMELAYEYGYDWELIKSPGPWDVDALFKRNVHGVPRDVLENQIDRYQPMVSDTEWTNLEIFK